MAKDKTQKYKSVYNETTLLAVGSMLCKQQLSLTSDYLNDYEFKIFSQWGDGSIQYLIRNIRIENENLHRIRGRGLRRIKYTLSIICSMAHPPAALTFLADKKGYSLAGCSKAGNNAYFVRKDLLNSRIRKVSVEQSFRESRFREARNMDFPLSYLGFEDRVKLRAGLELVNVISGQLEKF